jgi:hypothetical protein
MWKVSKNKWGADPLQREMHPCILALPSRGCTFLGIVLSCRLRALIPRPGIDLGFRLISIEALLCMCPHSMYLVVYKGKSRGIGFLNSVFQGRSSG